MTSFAATADECQGDLPDRNPCCPLNLSAEWFGGQSRIEIEEKYCEMAAARLRQGVLNFKAK